jgi:platelet-activating factor acetylhydrolase
VRLTVTLTERKRYFPGLLSYITIPVLKNAPLLPPNTESGRWPVMIFSHGLGGSRNAYSNLVGAIASHGMIVIAPEHRDGSCPVTYIRNVPSLNSTSEKRSPKYERRMVDYNRLSHTPSPEVEAGRNAQLKIRLWELGLVHDSILKLDLGEILTNLNTSSTSLSIFKNLMDVHTPGKMTFAGHSFGAATITQFVKSTFYSPRTSEAPPSYETLFTPSSRSPISSQITPQTPVILLDIWCLPLRTAATRWLWNQPFPCYQPTGPGGSALLAVESQAFYKWRVHLKATKRLLSPNPSTDNYDYQDGAISEPNFFYASSSAHLSQSDFGVLFPWVIKKVFSAEEPERVIKLNTRAILQLLRNQNIEIGATCAADMELADTTKADTTDDTLILGKNGEVRGWNWLSTNVEGLEDVDDDEEGDEEKGVGMKEPSEALVGNELLKRQEGTSESLEREISV